MQDNCPVKIAVRERASSAEDAVSSRVISYYDENKHIMSVGERAFSFDYILGQEVSQLEIFDELIRPLMGKVREGFNCTALAYGETGAGKTYTIGLDETKFDGDHAGVIPRLMRELIAHKCDAQKIQVSFIEIYNEKVYDLLSTQPREQILCKGWKTFSGTLRSITDMEDCRSVLLEGVKNRHVRPTVLNSQSSRSHAIFCVHLTQRLHGRTIISYFNLVDLAGSEGVRRTGNEGLAKAEGVNINQGLLGIGKVLQAMAAGNKVVPYRDSVLSLVLQDSLSPRSFLTLLACINPYHLQGTLCTLRFAQNAKLVKHMPQINSFLNEFRRTNAANRQPFSGLGPQGSTVKRLERPHGNTFCTPGKKHKVAASLKFNQSSVGLTPTAKKKLLQRMAEQKSAKKPPPLLTPFRIPAPTNATGYNNNSLESSMSISLQSLNFSSSTQMEANEPVSTAKPQSTNYSPVIRKLEDKVATLMDMISKLQTCMPEATMQWSLSTKDPPVASTTTTVATTDEEPRQFFTTSSPIFKEPAVPVYKRKKRDTEFFVASTSISADDTSESTLGDTRRRSHRLFIKEKNRRFADISSINCPSPVRESRKPPTAAEKMNPVSTVLMMDKKNKTKYRRAMLNLLNTGTLKDLQKLPKIGPKTAYQIVLQRSSNGHYKSIKDVEKLPIWKSVSWERFAEANCL